ncbi:Bile salt-activated lipase, partial [Stegodyphus mimosarum]
MATDERTAMVEELKFSPYTSFFGIEDLIRSPKVKECDNSEIMKLPVKDIGLFGYCPVYDDVCLVICNNCHRSIKPQAIESHRKKCITDSSDPHKSSASVTQINQINSRISEGAKLSNTGRNDKKGTYSSSSNNGFNHSIDQILSAKVVVRKLSPTGESIKNNSQKLSSIGEESIRSNSSVLPHYQYLPSTSGPGPGDHSITRTFQFSNSGIISDSYVNIKNFSSETLSNISPVVVLSNTFPINSALTTIKTENFVKQFRAKEFNPDQHCGVRMADGNPCVKALTCKQHRRELRRAVPGRSKELDVLIKEQKARRKVASTKLMQNNSCANSINFQNEKRTSMEFQSLNCIPNNCIKICLEPSELQNYERANCVPFSRNGNESCLLLPTEDSCNQSAQDNVQPLDYGPCVEPTIEYGPPTEPTIEYGPPTEPAIEYGPPTEPAIDYGPPTEPTIDYGPPTEPTIDYGPPPTEPTIDYGPPPTEPTIDYGPPPTEPTIDYGPPPTEPTILCQTESTDQLPNSNPQEELRNSSDCEDFKTGCLAFSCASKIETCDTFCELNNCTENSIKIPEIENLPEIEPTVSSQVDVKSPSPAPSWNR